MSREPDRIAVPANGHKPRPSRRKARPQEAPPGTTPETPPEAIQPTDPVPTVTSPELTVSVTPAQIAVGFGVIAGIILLVLGRRRGRGKG